MIYNDNMPDLLVKVRKHARKLYNAFRNRTTSDWYRYAGHSSHAACEALRRAGDKYALFHFGVEGFCDPCGREGISYLNMGDTYDLTVCFDSRTNRFLIASWGSIVEFDPEVQEWSGYNQE